MVVVFPTQHPRIQFDAFHRPRAAHAHEDPRLEQRSNVSVHGADRQVRRSVELGNRQRPSTPDQELDQRALHPRIPKLPARHDAFHSFVRKLDLGLALDRFPGRHARTGQE